MLLLLTLLAALLFGTELCVTVALSLVSADGAVTGTAVLTLEAGPVLPVATGACGWADSGLAAPTA